MERREALPLAALLLTAPLLSQARPSSGPQSQKPAAPDGPAVTPDDLEKMRSYLQQLQANLAMLPSGYSAVKHQFEIEIDMWRLVLGIWERNPRS
ncbi:MAG TPA: hypothetical protein VLA96_04290 [Terriglobales bacterium]|nr:hypothetical protein [Terriglobales bacterium]